ncbi:Sjogren's syndrome/scleroderma autoantigen 1 family protein [Haloarchaeobius amylolyticus]|uniref:Sjogren's syndrome/scleroderma autoantigen 1 family protein n=1 Tax=Haloarchaeobius amylolyticus TaxID=1198296 RepID=UPI00227214B8|nr:Sjogren's syndrome/scleroderma autoantigen 1 family protein [Haloarchaeobius amylolyticus]
MSEFDKEAEREKLREKFAKDEEDRKSTQRMSELLLQGATMTNQHCDTCGDPIFRYQGQEFCPSCQNAAQEAQRQQAQQQQAQQQAQQQQAADQQAQRAGQAQDAQQANVSEADGETVADPATADQSSAQQPVATGATPGRQAGSVGAGAGATGAEPRQVDRSAAGASLAGEFGEAEASIAETIRYFSDAAANTDDPARARECLAAVKEAAEALSTLRR